MATLKDILRTYTALQLLEMGLNYIHESAHAVYLKNVYNATVVAFFLVDELFRADRTIPIEDKFESAVKWVQKLSTTKKHYWGRHVVGEAQLQGEVGQAVEVATTRV
jgi:hypothetical protein